MRNRFMLLLVMAVPIVAFAAGTGQQPASSGTHQTTQQPGVARPGSAPLQPTAASAPVYKLDGVVIDGGGKTLLQGLAFRVGVSIAQPVTGEATSASYRLGLGYWYGGSVISAACPVEMTGDVNVSGSLTSADIIYLVNFVFKGAAPPLPCEAAGDVNCSNAVTSADIIYMVNHVFKGGPAPCDACEVVDWYHSCSGL